MKEQIKRSLFNLLFRVKYYSFHKQSQRPQDRIIIIFDEIKNYCGLADIIKSIVGVYYVAKQNGLGFKIYCKYPLELSKYLQPTLVDWQIDKEDINRCIFQTKLINYTGIEAVAPIKKGVEYHVYNFVGKNILQNTKGKNWEQEWHKLFTDLFRPTSFVLNVIKEQGLPEGEYIAVHIRFLNCLEAVEPDALTYSRPLDSSKRNKLLTCLFNAIDLLKQDFKVVVFSDSKVFAKMSKQRGYDILEGDIGHLSYNQSEETTLKTFVDWYCISRAKKIYSLRGGPLYNSAFPLYASLIGNKEYNEINISESYEG